MSVGREGQGEWAGLVWFLVWCGVFKYIYIYGNPPPMDLPAFGNQWYVTYIYIYIHTLGARHGWFPLVSR